jgi:hypothetical protein
MSDPCNGSLTHPIPIPATDTSPTYSNWAEHVERQRCLSTAAGSKPRHASNGALVQTRVDTKP